MREARAAYLTDDAAAQAADLQQSELEGRIAAAWRATYEQGSIDAPAGVTVDPAVVFADGEWADWATRIGRALLTSDSGARPVDEAASYLEAVAASLEPAPGEPVEQHVEGWISELAGGVGHIRARLEELAAVQETPVWESALLRLEALRQLADVTAESGLPAAVQQAFGGLAGLTSGVQAWRQWQDSLDLIGDLMAHVRFVRQAYVPDAKPQLALEHRTLEAQLHDPELQGSPQRWASLVQAAEGFQERFSQAYIAHHEDYHARVGLLGHRTRDMHIRATALEMLNTVTELGSPVADDLPGLVEEMHNAIGSCHMALSAADILDEAACPRCGIDLATEPPELEAAQLDGYVQEALDAQTLRLSRLVVQRLLVRDSHERVDRLIQAVQASDLNSLAKVMDDDLVGFIRDLLREPMGSTGAR